MNRKVRNIHAVLLFSTLSLMNESAAYSADLESPRSFAGFDPASRATIRFVNDKLTLDIPRNIVSGIFLFPDYCSSGRGFCGQVTIPEIAVLYPGMKPIPANRVNEFRIFSAAASPELIAITIQAPDRELARVAAFLSSSFLNNPLPSPFGLERSPEFPGEFFAYFKTSNRLSISCPRPEQTTLLQQCSANKYFFGNVAVNYTFNVRLLPHWKAINEEISSLIKSFRTDG